jgi:hypothetical protein
MDGRKKYVVFISVLFITITCSKGEIKNGYASQINGMPESLKTLHTMLIDNPNLSMFQKASIKSNINKLAAYISYFELTEELLNQFKTITPEMYYEIDNLKDNLGQEVSVFVKFVSEDEIEHGAPGTTNLAHADFDKNIYSSEYGPHTVSIKIASVTKALIFLAHEFGHVKYQVPNLASYSEFYAANYQNTTFDSKYIGHNSNDRSGQSAIKFEILFRWNYKVFLKANNLKPENPVARLQQIRKNIFQL